jgi:Rha family phage regulatory protein
MNDLTIIKHNNILMVDSREVAEMVDKEHAHLLRDIQGYMDVLRESNFGFSDFFIESSYRVEGNNKTYPCYLLTRKGCDMVANKMTGEKGVLFTAAYVTKFEEMEKELTAPMQNLSPQLQLLISMELKQNEMQKEITENKEAVQSIRDVVSLNTTSWRIDSAVLIGKMAHEMGGPEHIRDLRKESYKLLDTRMGVSLEIRLTNKRRRMAEVGVCKSKRDALNPLDVIAEDKKLVEGYVAIMKDMAIRYGV